MTDRSSLAATVRNGARTALHAAPDWMSEAAFDARRAVRRRTARSRVLPDFIIIGVHKGGTTALYHYLADHPQVVRATAKELHYFYRHHDGDHLSYRAMLPTTAQMSLVARRHGTALTGEASPSYISHPHIPARVHAMVPNVKLIALLRNPVARAISAFHHLVRRT